MTIPAWPSIFPKPQLGTYKLNRVDLAARRSLQVGPPIARQRSSRQSASIAECSVIMSDAQMAIFESWWHYTLNQGVAWFSLALPTNGGLSSPTTVNVRCTDGYRAQPVTLGFWTLSLPLQIDHAGGT